MSLLSDIVKSPLLRRVSAAARAQATQMKVLKRLLLKAGNTAFGQEYHFSDIVFSDHVVQEYQKLVPWHDYEKMHPWWQRAFDGEKSVTWPGNIKFFALSSGTSEGSSKYIPVTSQTIKAIRRASIKQVVAAGRCKAIPKDCFAKHSLVVGGSTDLNFNGTNYSGDLSGITTSHVPFWYEPFTKPEPAIRRTKNWAEKLDEIVKNAPRWDVGIIAGVPAWIQILLERIIKEYDLNHIHDIWPNFMVYVHGGVSISPYKDSLNKLCGKPITYWDSYLASEGYFAYQTKPDAPGMKMILNTGVFYEFVPFDENNFDADGNLLANAHFLTIKDVKPNVEYALLISTCSGAWRYFIGDVIEFLNTTKFEIKIIGRTKHYLSLCGEHLSVDNMNAALIDTCKKFGIISNEYTVIGHTHEGRHAHHWYVGTDRLVDKETFKQFLDQRICELNDDYAVERKHALPYIFLTFLPNEKFNEFLALKGKQGGQIKFPRVLKGSIKDDWEQFVGKESL
ncbi:MAG: GH3 auxin-responsive promoter [Flavobacteriaceae bacterium]|nr:GH3 auxin-responsive promoter [Flavobacteriaceae bacterium]